MMSINQNQDLGYSLDQKFNQKIVSICGVLVHVHPDRRKQAEAGMYEISGLEIHGGSEEEGKLVVTVETDSYKKTGDAITRLQNVEGILSVSMIYQHAEELDADESEQIKSNQINKQ